MNLTQIKPIKKALHSRKRVGRGPGSGLGKTSGRGFNGQQSRSGYSRRYGFEGGQMPIVRRMPKRGFSNCPFREETQIVNLIDLERVFTGGEVTVVEMKKAGLVKGEKAKVRVLAKGSLTKSLVVHANHFSQKAAEAITSAGGKAVVIGQE